MGSAVGEDKGKKIHKPTSPFQTKNYPWGDTFIPNKTRKHSPVVTDVVALATRHQRRKMKRTNQRRALSHNSKMCSSETVHHLTANQLWAAYLRAEIKLPDPSGISWQNHLNTIIIKLNSWLNLKLILTSGLFLVTTEGQPEMTTWEVVAHAYTQKNSNRRPAGKWQQSSEFF